MTNIKNCETKARIKYLLSGAGSSASTPVNKRKRKRKISGGTVLGTKWYVKQKNSPASDAERGCKQSSKIQRVKDFPFFQTSGNF